MPKQNFNLDKTLYSETSVHTAIAAFEGYDIVFDSGILSIDDTDPQVVFDEFSNYCIAISDEILD